MSFIPSLLLYNPLESFLLLYACFLFRNKENKDIKFDFKKYLIHSYILGSIFLLIQWPTTRINNPMLHIIYDGIIVSVLMCIILYFYINEFMHIKKPLIFVAFIIIFYTSSIDIFVSIFNNYFSFIYSNTKLLLDELKINISLKLFQFIILFGVYFMKQMLINMAKFNIGKCIAATSRNVYEPELSKELMEEIK